MHTYIYIYNDYLSGKQQIRGSFGAWQGKKFALMQRQEGFERESEERESGGVAQFPRVPAIRKSLDRPQSAGASLLANGPDQLQLPLDQLQLHGTGRSVTEP
jgi:hypothetical protein